MVNGCHTFWVPVCFAKMLTTLKAIRNKKDTTSGAFSETLYSKIDIAVHKLNEELFRNYN